MSKPNRPGISGPSEVIFFMFSEMLSDITRSPEVSAVEFQ